MSKEITQEQREHRWAEQDQQVLNDLSQLRRVMEPEGAPKKIAADMALHYETARENPNRVRHLRAQGNSEADIDCIVAWEIARTGLDVAPVSVAASGQVRKLLAPLVTELRYGHEDAAKRVGNSAWWPCGKEPGPTDADFNALAARVEAKQAERHGEVS